MARAKQSDLLPDCWLQRKGGVANMNKKMIALFAFLVGIVGIGLVNASPRLEATYSTLEVTASSGIIFRDSGWIKGVQLSTPTSGSTFGNDWLVILDTAPSNGLTGYSQFATGNKKTLPLIYTSTPNVTSTNPQPNNNVFWFEEPGIFISTGAYYFKTQASSGEAFKALFYFKK